MSDAGVPSAILPLASPEWLLVVFFVVWTGMALLAKVLFGRPGNAAWKRRAWLPFNAGSSLVFVGFVWAFCFPVVTVGIALVSVAAITIYSAKMVWFCDECGGRALDRLGQARETTCPRCGAKREWPLI